MPGDEVIYNLTDVNRTFRLGGSEVRAVDGVNLQIGAGELVAIQGPSGSGKSTLLLLLGGLEAATSGSVYLGDVDLGKVGDKQLTRLRSQQIGFVFQAFNLIPTLTAAENIEAAMIPLEADRKLRRDRISRLLSMVGLEERSKHLPTLLSGGEQQRVAIARALANSPRVLLADEPTGNLDSATADEIVEILRKLSQEESVTVIIVTHSDEIAAKAHRTVRMRDGRLMEATA